MPLSRRCLALFLAVPLVAPLVPGEEADAVSELATGASTATATAPRRQVVYTQWDSRHQFRTGLRDGVRIGRGHVVMNDPTETRTYAGHTYDTAAWTSPWVTPGISFTQLVASWKATTPGDSWIEVRVRGRNATSTSSWDVLGRWTSGDAHTKRQTVSGQDDDLASVDVDTWKAPAGLTSYQLSVSLLRRHGTEASPTLDTVGAVVSRLPAAAGPTSKPGVARGVVLDVPQYSQMIHEGDFPQWNGGGEAWCSPTSTTMVLGYYKRLPPASAYSWVPQGHHDPYVDYAARSTFDYAYDGTGNWPFNTAYAASRVGHAFVTRLRSLREAERFIAVGIPLVASISFGPGGLDGAPISSTAGHLVVIRGFTQDGDVVVNDPAAKADAGVRHVYDRGQFEAAWLGGSGGTVYVIHDDAHPLPEGPQTNW